MKKHVYICIDLTIHSILSVSAVFVFYVFVKYTSGNSVFSDAS